MSEPDFISQTGECETEEDGRRWIRERADEMRAQGAVLLRASIHPDFDHLLLMEGWKEYTEDQGEPRWQLTTTR